MKMKINKKPMWAMQKFAINDNDAKGMIDSIKSLGLECHLLDFAPFCYDNLQPVPYEGMLFLMVELNSLILLKGRKDGFVYLMIILNIQLLLTNLEKECLIAMVNV